MMYTPNFNRDYFITQLEKYSAEMYESKTNIDRTIEMFSHIYNYRKRDKLVFSDIVKNIYE